MFTYQCVFYWRKNFHKRNIRKSNGFHNRREKKVFMENSPDAGNAQRNNDPSIRTFGDWCFVLCGEHGGWQTWRHTQYIYTHKHTFSRSQTHTYVPLNIICMIFYDYNVTGFFEFRVHNCCIWAFRFEGAVFGCARAKGLSSGTARAVTLTERNVGWCAARGVQPGPDRGHWTFPPLGEYLSCRRRRFAWGESAPLMPRSVARDLVQQRLTSGNNVCLAMTFPTQFFTRVTNIRASPFSAVFVVQTVTELGRRRSSVRTAVAGSPL